MLALDGDCQRGSVFGGGFLPLFSFYSAIKELFCLVVVWVAFGKSVTQESITLLGDAMTQTTSSPLACRAWEQ